MDSSTRKRLRATGHSLKPVVTVADNGLSDPVLAEVERALDDHELIKVRLNVPEPRERRLLAQELCTRLNAELIQTIGKIALVFRQPEKPAKHSNLR